MIRFRPDHWLDGLARPVLMADPAAGLYYEEGAPDLRFALLVLLSLALLLAGRRRRPVPRLVWGSLAALAAVFYLWTFVIGNGRYLMPGLLLAGPLLVALWQGLPGTRYLRWSLLLLVVLIQGWMVQSMLRPGAWWLVRWESGPAIRVAPSPLREKPIAVMTISSISYSALVPFFHPQSRWINAFGQIAMRPNLPEWKAAQGLLHGPLPLYLLVPADVPETARTVPEGPQEATWSLIEEPLSEQGLAPLGRRCEIIATNLLPMGSSPTVIPEHARGGFWLCPIGHAPTPERLRERFADPHADVFARVEAACPRYFAPGAAETRQYKGFWQRYYLGSDMRLIVDASGNVLYRYFRHFTPVRVASVGEVLAPGWTLDCTRLKGRYLPFWSEGR